MIFLSTSELNVHGINTTFMWFWYSSMLLNIVLIVWATIKLGRIPFSSWLKIVWFLLILFVPFIGPLAVLVTRKERSSQKVVFN